jgi:uncharacterized membrane protein
MPGSGSTGRGAIRRLACLAAAGGVCGPGAMPFAVGMEGPAVATARIVVLDIRAAGYEPDWTFRLDHEGRLNFSAGRMHSLALIGAPAAGGVGTPGGVVYGTQTDADQLVAEVATGSCTDGRSGERLTHRVTIRYRGAEYRGCGTLVEVLLR